MGALADRNRQTARYARLGKTIHSWLEISLPGPPDTWPSVLRRLGEESRERGDLLAYHLFNIVANELEREAVK
jgi:hypothetical protein